MNPIHHVMSTAKPSVEHSSSSVNRSIHRCGSSSELLMTNTCQRFTAIEIPDDIQDDFDGIENFNYFYSPRYFSYSEELGHHDEEGNECYQALDISEIKESDILKHLSKYDEKSCVEKIKAFICSRKGALTIVGIVVIAGLSYLVLRPTNSDKIAVAKRSASDSNSSNESITATSGESSTTEASTTTVPLKTIENLDYDSTLAAASECGTNSSSELEVLIKLNKADCTDSVLKEIFCTSDNPTPSDASNTTPSCSHNNVIWQSSNSDAPSVMVKASCEQFETIVGASVTKADCIDSISAERLKIPTVQASIKNALKNSAQDQFNAQLQSFENPNEICVSLDEEGIDIANLGGGVGMQIRPVECKPKFDASSQNVQQPVAPADQMIAEAAKNSCVRRVALISDGMSDPSRMGSESYGFNSNISPISQQTSSSNTHQTCSNAADKLVSSMLRRCPELEIVDVHATTDIQSNASGVDSAGQCISVLSGNNLVQSLDALSKFERVNETTNTTTPSGFEGGNNSTDTGKLDAVIVFEPVEVGGYTGDVPLTQEMVKALEAQNIPVYAYESSQNSWLRSVPNIKQTSSVTEMVAKPTLIPVDLPYQRSYEASTVAATAAGLTGVGLSAMYCLYKNRKKATIKQSSMVEEAIPLEVIEENVDEDDECEDCILTTTENPDGSVSTKKTYVVPGTEDVLEITRTISRTGTIKQKMTQSFGATDKTHTIETAHTSRGIFELKEFGYQEGKNPVCRSTSSRFQIATPQPKVDAPSTSSERQPFLNLPKKEV